MEPNDSPEIPDRGETSDIPGLPSGVSITTRVLCIQVHAYYLYEYTGAVYTGKRVLYLKNLKKKKLELVL